MWVGCFSEEGCALPIIFIKRHPCKSIINPLALDSGKNLYMSIFLLLYLQICCTVSLLRSGPGMSLVSVALPTWVPGGGRAPPGSSNTLFGNPKFRRIITLALWCRPPQTSHWLPHAPLFPSLPPPPLKFMWRCPCLVRSS